MFIGDKMEQKLATFGNDKTTTKYFVVKTTINTKDMYKDSNESQKGKANPISQAEYDKTVDEIKKGIFTSKNIVYIGKEKRLKAMLESIKDDGTGGDSEKNNREYSGSFSRDGNGVVNLKVGKVQNPWNGSNAISSGSPKFHSHPSGSIRKYIKGEAYTASWQQPPSKQDINTAKGTEYVVGMGKGIVYRYDKNGVNAVFPINIAK